MRAHGTTARAHARGNLHKGTCRWGMLLRGKGAHTRQRSGVNLAPGALKAAGHNGHVLAQLPQVRLAHKRAP